MNSVDYSVSFKAFKVQKALIMSFCHNQSLKKVILKFRFHIFGDVIHLRNNHNLESQINICCLMPSKCQINE